MSAVQSLSADTSAAELTHQRLAEPELTFDPDSSQRHVNPLAGLVMHGPYSAGLWGPEKIIRVATLGPTDARGPLKQLLEELRDPADPQERRDYLPPYPGFASAVRCRLHPADTARRDLPDGWTANWPLARRRIRHSSAALVDGLRTLNTQRTEFDVLVFTCLHAGSRISPRTASTSTTTSRRTRRLSA